MPDLQQCAAELVTRFREETGSLPEVIATHPADIAANPSIVTNLWDATLGKVMLLCDAKCPRGIVHVGALLDFAPKVESVETPPGKLSLVKR